MDAALRIRNLEYDIECGMCGSTRGKSEMAARIAWVALMLLCCGCSRRMHEVDVREVPRPEQIEREVPGILHNGTGKIPMH